MPKQTPQKVLSQLREHLDKHGYSDIHITYLGGESPSKIAASDPFVQLVVSTAKDVYGTAMQIVPMTGGSGPNFIVQDALQIPIASLGVGYPGSGAHSPNENIRLQDYLKSAKHLVRVMGEFGRE